jgi:hypothetical protein
VLAELAEVQRAQGKATEARRTAEAALVGARKVKQPLSLGPALAVSARLTAAEGHPQEALALARQARDAYAARETKVGVDAMEVWIKELEAPTPR